MKKYVGLSMSVVLFSLLTSGCESENGENIQTVSPVNGKIILSSKKSAGNEQKSLKK
jgi:predicted small secreted protein